MSDIISPNDIGKETVYLLPSQIVTNSRYNVRPFSSESTDAEDRLITQLAQAIEDVGQLDALVVTPEHLLIAGHRRRKAVIVANERRSARGASLIRLRCVIDPTGGDLRRKSIMSNLHRKDNSAMDLAYLIAQTRQEYSWTGRPGTVKVAEYLGVDVATVYQHEKFLGAEKELQNRIHDGTISAHSALDLLKNLPSPKDRSDALDRAAEIQSEDRLEKTMESYRNGSTSLKQATAALNKQPPRRIEHPAIVKAIRERHTVTTTTHSNRVKLALSRAELVQSIAQFDAPDYPEAARIFARYWTHQYSMGIGTTEELRAKFHALAETPQPIMGQAPQPTESVSN